MHESCCLEGPGGFRYKMELGGIMNYIILGQFIIPVFWLIVTAAMVSCIDQETDLSTKYERHLSTIIRPITDRQYKHELTYQAPMVSKTTYLNLSSLSRYLWFIIIYTTSQGRSFIQILQNPGCLQMVFKSSSGTKSWFGERWVNLTMYLMTKD